MKLSLPSGAAAWARFWLARELKLERMVALKVLRADLTQDSTRVTRFRQEARAASALNHPNVCTIHALGETPDGQQFIAMEHVEGETLRQRLADAPLRLREALDIAVQVASALSARARRRHRAPRSQARKRDAPARRLRQGVGLRPGEAGARAASPWRTRL